LHATGGGALRVRATISRFLPTCEPAMSTTADTARVPPSREFGAVWVSYALFGVGAFLWWPELIGLVVCYAKRGDDQSGFIDSHYRWLIATFWLSLLGYLLSLALILAGLWPIVRDVLRTVAERGTDWDPSNTIHIDWSAILTTIGGATIGGLGMLFVWCWYVYRVIRGALRLHAARPAP
jgi:uncharacterized membrane protein